MPRPTKVILSAEAIKQQWENQAQGKPAVAPSVAIDLANKNADLEKKVAELEETAKKRKYDPAGLRQKLEAILSSHNISAAFEPLVEMALARHPDDFPIEQLRGQFVCTVDQRIKIWTELLQYQMPKLKAVEVAGQIDNSITVVVRRFGDDAIIERQANTQPPMPQITEVAAKVEPQDGPRVSVKKF